MDQQTACKWMVDYNSSIYQQNIVIGIFWFLFGVWEEMTGHILQGFGSSLLLIMVCQVPNRNINNDQCTEEEEVLVLVVI